MSKNWQNFQAGPAEPGQCHAPGPVVIFSASVGAGHDGASTDLACRLEDQGQPVVRHDFLEMLPTGAGIGADTGTGTGGSTGGIGDARVHRGAQTDDEVAA